MLITFFAAYGLACMAPEIFYHFCNAEQQKYSCFWLAYMNFILFRINTRYSWQSISV